jgi:2-dehydropantoate 2-reductase
VKSDVLGSVRVTPPASDALDRSVDLLVVAVKAPELGAALDRIPRPQGVDVVIPLLNGLEHLPILEDRFEGRVAAASISRIEAYRNRAGVIHATGRPRITVAIGHRPGVGLRRALAILRVAELDVTSALTPTQVLWPKLIRLAPLAAVTAAFGVTCGVACTRHRDYLEAAVAETCAVARVAAGRSPDHPTVMRQLERLPEDLETSLQRDVRRGQSGEADAILGAILRLGRSHRLPCPTLETLSGWIDERLLAVTGCLDLTPNAEVRGGVRRPAPSDPPRQAPA